jgi:hypothetical protein
MSQFDNVVFQVLRTNANIGNDLIKQIESIAEQEKFDYSWQDNKVLNAFIDGLKLHVSVNEKDWQKDDTFLELINAVNNQIIIQINDGEKDMATGTELATTGTGLAIGTKFIIVAGVLSVIAIALYAYRDAKNKVGRGSNEKNETSALSGLKEKAGEFIDEVKAGLPSNKPQQQVSPSSQPLKKTTPIYGQYVLLLIIEANRLDKNLKLGSFSKAEAEKLISNAMFAYCFAENDADGQTVLEAVDCLDEDKDINYESEDKVFLQISLSAKPEIAEGKRDKLGIREAMNPNQRVEIKTPRKLKTTRSIKAFYSI